jgi:hypothetical protein
MPVRRSSTGPAAIGRPGARSRPQKLSKIPLRGRHAGAFPVAGARPTVVQESQASMASIRQLTDCAARYAALTLLGATGFLCAVVPGAAQRPDAARFIVHVSDETQAAPLVGVQVRLLRGGLTGLTNAAGVAEVYSALLGPDTLEVVRLGHLTQRIPVFLNRGTTSHARITMPAAPVVLEPIVVRQRRAPRPTLGAFAGFWQRRARGQGYFVTRAQIEAAQAMYMTDVLRGVPGLRFVAGRHGSFDVSLGRARPISRDPGYQARALHNNPDFAPNDCPVQLFVEGHPYHNDTMSFDEAFRPNEIEAVEIYNSPGQTPAQFGGTRAQCGVIVVWLRRGL